MAAFSVSARFPASCRLAQGELGSGAGGGPGVGTRAVEPDGGCACRGGVAAAACCGDFGGDPPGDFCAGLFSAGFAVWQRRHSGRSDQLVRKQPGHVHSTRRFGPSRFLGLRSAPKISCANSFPS